MIWPNICAHGLPIEGPRCPQCEAADMGSHGAFMALSPHPWRIRFWQRLGFGARDARPTPEQEENLCQSKMGHVIMMESVTRLDWRDRLRALVSGCIVTHSRTYTDNSPGRTFSISNTGVMWPGWKHDGEKTAEHS